MNNVTFEATAASAARVDMAGTIQSARDEMRRNRRVGAASVNQSLVKQMTEHLKVLGMATGMCAERADDTRAAFRTVPPGHMDHGLTPIDMPEYGLWHDEKGFDMLTVGLPHDSMMVNFDKSPSFEQVQNEARWRME